MYKLYTTKYINAISFICSIIVFISICLINKQIKNNQFSFSSIFKLGNQDKITVQFDSIENTKEKQEEKQEATENVTSNIQKAVNIEENKQEETKEKWNLKIPRIFLEAKISEGTSKEVMDVNIGHFEETSKTYGNVGLAAHNRGYPVNYFENLKLLTKGDIIQYEYNEYIKEYIITENKIIKDTDWGYLKKTEENTITLITCVENEPQYRRCVKGTEKK